MTHIAFFIHFIFVRTKHCLVYLVFVCPGQLACVLHLLLVRTPLLGIRGNSQFSDLVPERDDVDKKTRLIMFNQLT